MSNSLDDIDLTCVVSFASSFFNDMGAEENNSILATAELLIEAAKFIENKSKSNVLVSSLDVFIKETEANTSATLALLQKLLIGVVVLLVIISIVFMVIVWTALFKWKDPGVAVASILFYIITIIVIHYYIRRSISRLVISFEQKIQTSLAKLDQAVLDYKRGLTNGISLSEALAGLSETLSLPNRNNEDLKLHTERALVSFAENDPQFPLSLVLSETYSNLSERFLLTVFDGVYFSIILAVIVVLAIAIFSQIFTPSQTILASLLLVVILFIVITLLLSTVIIDDGGSTELLASELEKLESNQLQMALCSY